MNLSHKPFQVFSGGQTGVDRAALDVAISLSLPYGGWCPKGRIAEDGIIPAKYQLLQETLTNDYNERTELNVRDTDGTLILTIGEPIGGTKYTLEMAKKYDKPYLTIDLQEKTDYKQVIAWIDQFKIKALNVAGPRESTINGIRHQARLFLTSIFTRLG